MTLIYICILSINIISNNKCIQSYPKMAMVF